VNFELPVSGGGNAPDKISGVSRFCARFVEPGAIHRIVPPCFLTGETLRADGREEDLPGNWGGRDNATAVRSMHRLTTQRIESIGSPPNDRSRDNMKRNRRDHCDNDGKRAVLDIGAIVS
jgi:hypothetical protein